MHYDPDEKCMYKSTRVAEKEGFIVVFRKRQFKDGRWSAREATIPIFAKDVVEMTNSYTNTTTSTTTTTTMNKL